MFGASHIPLIKGSVRETLCRKSLFLWNLLYTIEEMKSGLPIACTSLQKETRSSLELHEQGPTKCEKLGTNVW